MCVIKEVCLRTHRLRNRTLPVFQKLPGTPPHCISLRDINHPYFCIDHFLSSSVDVPKANTNLGMQGRGSVAIILRKLHGPSWNSLPLDLNRSSWSSLELELRDCRETFGGGHERIMGNGISHSWGVWRTAVGPAVGILKVVQSGGVGRFIFYFCL